MTHDQAGGPLEVPAIDVPGGWETMLDGPAREALERSALPDFLRSQRWFGGKARRVESVRLADWGALPCTSGPAFWALLDVHFADGKSDSYFMPLGVVSGAAAVRLVESMRPWVLATLRGPAGEAVLHDALADDEVCTALLSSIQDGKEFSTREGRIIGEPAAAFARLRGDPAQPLPVVRGPATSSNSLLFYGGRLLLKLFRRLEPGVNPDFEVGRFLTEQSPFGRTPAAAGALEYRRPNAPPVTLAVLQEFVPNQGDGWRHALAELTRYYEWAAGQPAGDGPPPAAPEAVGAYLRAAALLGRRTAEMHRALARDAGAPAFAPEPMTPSDLAALREGVAGQARRALAALRDNLDRLPAPAREAAVPLLEDADLPDRVSQSVPERVEAAKIRCHGDYHLGQVLRVDDDFVILDFEGEPTRTVEERRCKQSPLKDVAGMLRSFDYAAHAGLFAIMEGRTGDSGRLSPWAGAWRRWVSAAFLRAYLDAAGAAPFLPAGPDSFAALLDAFTLEKAFYELSYELNNRPDWVRIPLGGVLALLGRGG